MRLLAEHGDVVPVARPLARELARVDVRPRAAEQVPVPDEDAHATILRDGAAEASQNVRKLQLVTSARGAEQGLSPEQIWLDQAARSEQVTSCNLRCQALAEPIVSEASRARSRRDSTHDGNHGRGLRARSLRHARPQRAHLVATRTLVGTRTLAADAARSRRRRYVRWK